MDPLSKLCCTLKIFQLKNVIIPSRIAAPIKRTAFRARERRRPFIMRNSWLGHHIHVKVSLAVIALCFVVNITIVSKVDMAVIYMVDVALTTVYKTTATKVESAVIVL